MALGSLSRERRGVGRYSCILLFDNFADGGLLRRAAGRLNNPTSAQAAFAPLSACSQEGGRLLPKHSSSPYYSALHWTTLQYLDGSVILHDVRRTICDPHHLLRGHMGQSNPSHRCGTIPCLHLHIITILNRSAVNRPQISKECPH